MLSFFPESEHGKAFSVALWAGVTVTPSDPEVADSLSNWESQAGTVPSPTCQCEQLKWSAVRYLLGIDEQ